MKFCYSFILLISLNLCVESSVKVYVKSEKNLSQLGPSSVKIHVRRKKNVTLHDELDDVKSCEACALFKSYFDWNIPCRQDIRDDQDGLSFKISITVYNPDTWKPMSGVYVYLWNANAAGTYSGSEENVSSSPEQTNQTQQICSPRWLRGYYQTNTQGQVIFTTKIPGWTENKPPIMNILVSDQVMPKGQIIFYYKYFFEDSALYWLKLIQPYSENKLPLVYSCHSPMIKIEDYYEKIIKLTSTENGFCASITVPRYAGPETDRPEDFCSSLCGSRADLAQELTTESEQLNLSSPLENLNDYYNNSDFNPLSRLLQTSQRFTSLPSPQTSSLQDTDDNKTGQSSPPIYP